MIVTDVNPLSPAVHEGDGWYLVPLSTDPAYLDTQIAISEIAAPTGEEEVRGAWMASCFRGSVTAT